MGPQDDVVPMFRTLGSGLELCFTCLQPIGSTNMGTRSPARYRFSAEHDDVLYLARGGSRMIPNSKLAAFHNSEARLRACSHFLALASRTGLHSRMKRSNLHCRSTLQYLAIQLGGSCLQFFISCRSASSSLNFLTTCRVA